ncbi:MAG: TetR/AcrR family transcriptional regulator [Myxococcota bacterium]
MRNTPRQARASETVERLLTTSMALIEERGLDGFNTNLLAERVGVRVPSVYRYFPNKQAIVATLYRRLTEEWHPLFEEGFRRLADPALDWREECDALGRRLLDLLQRSPSRLAIRRAMRANEVLVEIEREDNQFVAERFAAAVAPRVRSHDEADLVVAGRTWINAMSAVVDVALELPRAEQEDQFRENFRLVRAYLAEYLD